MKSRLLVDADNYESDYGSLSLQNMALQRGQNIVTVDKNTPYNVLNIDGRTLVNGTGRDGNCEDTSKWTAINATLSLDSTNKSYGSNSLKVTSSASGGFSTTSASSYAIDNTKYYIVLGELRNNNATNCIIQTLKGSNAAVINFTTAVTDTTKFTVQYLKLSPTDFGAETSIKVNAYGNSTAASQSFSFDGVRIFQITQAEYNALGTTLTDINAIAAKYPYVDDMKYVQNPYLIKYGQNLLPPFQDWGLATSATIASSYSVSMTVSSFTIYAYNLPVVAGQQYTGSSIVGGYVPSSQTPYITIQFVDSNGNSLGYNDATTTANGLVTKTVTAPTNAVSANFILACNTTVSSTFTFTNPMLNVGSTVLPFVPQNNDYLFLNSTLASSVDGSMKDYVYYKDGLYYKSKRFVTDMVLDGSLSWTIGDFTGFKRLNALLANSVIGNVNGSIVKYDGKIIPRIYTDSMTTGDQFDVYTNNNVYLTINDSDSGWAEGWPGNTALVKTTYTNLNRDAQPSDMYKAFFNGWKWNGNGWTGIKSGVVNNNVDTVISVSDSGFTPYKLTYQLIQEQEELVQFEGDINLHVGGNQIEYGEGVIIREKATSYYYSGNGGRYFNDITDTTTFFKYKAGNVFALYKNGQKETKAQILTGTTGNGTRVKLNGTDYDPTAEYTVSYIVLQDGTFRSSVNSGNAVYNTNLRNIVNQMSQELTDVTTYADALGVRFQNYGIKGLGERVESGTYTFTLSSGVSTNVTINYSRSFANTPKIMLAFQPSAYNLGYNNVTFAAVTTTAFNIYAASYQGQTFVVHWIAIGT